MSARLVVTVAVLGVLTFALHDILLVAFGGILLAVLLSGLTDWLRARARFPRPLALLASCAVTAGIALTGAWLAGRLILGNLDAMLAAFAASIQAVRQAPWGTLFPDLQSVLPGAAGVVGRAATMLTSTVSGIVAIAVGVFVGVCLAIEPAFYRDGLVLLVPVTRRARVRAVLDEIGATLRAWLFARMISMLALGVLVTIGLTVLRIPFASSLGALAGLLAFIPNVGALIAALPAVLFALAIGPERAALVVGMYWLAHALDDFLVIPLAERRIVKLPPALTILVQLGLGSFAGLAGVAFAAPLTATAIVLVRRLWVEDVLEARPPLEKGRSRAAG